MGTLDTDRLAGFVHTVQPIYDIVDRRSSWVDDNWVEYKLARVCSQPWSAT